MISKAMSFSVDAGFQGGGEVEGEECTSRCMYELERLSYSIGLTPYRQRGGIDSKRNPLTMCILCSLSSTLSNRSPHQFELPAYHCHMEISKWYHIRKVKDGDHPFSCTDTDSLTRARDDALVATIVWQPAYSSRNAIGPTPIYPSVTWSECKAFSAPAITTDDVCSGRSAMSFEQNES
jgi:hypothetical protein